MSREAYEVLKRTRGLLREHAQSKEREELLSRLPQGHGSGLDADTVDGLHATEIIAKAVVRSSGGGVGSGAGVAPHSHTHVKGGSDAFDGASDVLSLRVEEVDELPAAVRGRMVLLRSDSHLYVAT